MKLKQFLSVLLAIILVGSLAFQPIAASNSDNIVDESSSENWWKSHPLWTQWLAGTLGGIVGSIVGTTVFSLASYPIFSSQEGVYHPQLSALYFGSMVGYPVGSALGAGYGVEKSGKLMGQEGNPLRTYLTSGIAAGVTFYGSGALGAGLNNLTVGPFVQQSLNMAVSSLAMSTPVMSSTAATWNYRWENKQENSE